MSSADLKNKIVSDKTLGTDTVTLSMGPQHPATHGTLRIELVLDGERVIRAIPHIGYLHTGFEKLAENLTYNQFVALSDRMNYLSPLSNNIGYAYAAEKLFGIEVTEKCHYVRVLLAEITRITDHLVCVGTAALDLGAFTVFLYTFQQRELLLDLFNIATGTRMTTSFTRVGGMAAELPQDFFDGLKEWLIGFPPILKDTETLLDRNKIWHDRTRDVGIIGGEEAVNYGLTGPALRSAGIPWDIRKNEPYAVYDQLDFDIPVGIKGDVFDRYWVRMEEMRQSLHLIQQTIDKMPSGSVNIDDGKTILPPKEHVYNSIEGLIHHFEITMENRGITPPKGEIYSSTEAPNGELGFYLISDETSNPYKLKVRAPSLANYQIFPDLLEGRNLSDCVAILGSLNIIAGELDR